MLVKYLSGMADDEECCPLCVEPYEPADKAIQFCVCGFQICMFCWKKIRETGNGCCPACRHQYTNEPMLRPARKPEEQQKQATKAAQISTAVTKKPAAGATSAQLKPVTKAPTRLAKSQLRDIRVVQRNLVYVIGLSPSLAKEALLASVKYFGQYGKILKVVTSRDTAVAQDKERGGATCSAFITYSKESEARTAIFAADGFWLEGRCIRVCFGTNKYCNAWLREETCKDGGGKADGDCFYLHEIASPEDSFSREEMLGPGNAYGWNFQELVHPNYHCRNGNGVVGGQGSTTPGTTAHACKEGAEVARAKGNVLPPLPSELLPVVLSRAPVPPAYAIPERRDRHGRRPQGLEIRAPQADREGGTGATSTAQGTASSGTAGRAGAAPLLPASSPIVEAASGGGQQGGRGAAHAAQASRAGSSSSSSSSASRVDAAAEGGSSAAAPSAVGAEGSSTSSSSGGGVKATGSGQAQQEQPEVHIPAVSDASLWPALPGRAATSSSSKSVGHSGAGKGSKGSAGAGSRQSEGAQANGQAPAPAAGGKGREQREKSAASKAKESHAAVQGPALAAAPSPAPAPAPAPSLLPATSPMGVMSAPDAFHVTGGSGGGGGQASTVSSSLEALLGPSTAALLNVSSQPFTPLVGGAAGAAGVSAGGLGSSTAASSAAVGSTAPGGSLGLPIGDLGLGSAFRSGGGLFGSGLALPPSSSSSMAPPSLLPTSLESLLRGESGAAPAPFSAPSSSLAVGGLGLGGGQGLGSLFGPPTGGESMGGLMGAGGTGSWLDRISSGSQGVGAMASGLPGPSAVAPAGTASQPSAPSLSSLGRPAVGGGLSGLGLHPAVPARVQALFDGPATTTSSTSKLPPSVEALFAAPRSGSTLAAGAGALDEAAALESLGIRTSLPVPAPTPSPAPSASTAPQQQDIASLLSGLSLLQPAPTNHVQAALQQQQQQQQAEAKLSVEQQQRALAAILIQQQQLEGARQRILAQAQAQQAAASLRAAAHPHPHPHQAGNAGGMNLLQALYGDGSASHSGVGGTGSSSVSHGGAGHGGLGLGLGLEGMLLQFQAAQQAQMALAKAKGGEGAGPSPIALPPGLGFATGPGAAVPPSAHAQAAQAPGASASASAPPASQGDSEEEGEGPQGAGGTAAGGKGAGRKKTRRGGKGSGRGGR